VVAEAAVLGVDLMAFWIGWFGHVGLYFLGLLFLVLVCICDFDCSLLEM
jgi:hypothetical protein